MPAVGIGSRFRHFGAFLLVLYAQPALAAVEITFVSKKLGSTFPHAYILLEGELDRSGEKIDANYGFTAKHASPAILLGPVKGAMRSENAPYVMKSDRHFSLILTDGEYDQVMQTVEKWRSFKQPSYNLNRQNCLHFVAEVAANLGLVAETPRALMKRPRSYLEWLARANYALLESRGSHFQHAELDVPEAGSTRSLDE